MLRGLKGLREVLTLRVLGRLLVLGRVLTLRGLRDLRRLVALRRLSLLGVAGLGGLLVLEGRRGLGSLRFLSGSSVPEVEHAFRGALGLVCGLTRVGEHITVLVDESVVDGRRGSRRCGHGKSSWSSRS